MLIHTLKCPTAFKTLTLRRQRFFLKLARNPKLFRHSTEMPSCTSKQTTLTYISQEHNSSHTTVSNALKKPELLFVS